MGGNISEALFIATLSQGHVEVPLALR